MPRLTIKGYIDELKFEEATAIAGGLFRESDYIRGFWKTLEFLQHDETVKDRTLEKIFDILRDI